MAAIDLLKIRTEAQIEEDVLKGTQEPLKKISDLETLAVLFRNKPIKGQVILKSVIEYHKQT